MNSPVGGVRLWSSLINKVLDVKPLVWEPAWIMKDIHNKGLRQQLGALWKSLPFLCGGIFSGLYLIMAAAKKPNVQTLAHYWEKIAQSDMIKKRLKCEVLQDVKPVLKVTTNNNGTPATLNNDGNVQAMLLQLTSSSRRMEKKLDLFLWTQKVFIVLLSCLTALWALTLLIHCSAGYCCWICATN